MPYVEVTEAIRIILKAGGVPVLAHPHEQQSYIDELLRAGLMGIEVNHPMLTEEERAVFIKIADEKKLYKTCGTDHSGVLGGYLQFGNHECDPLTCGMDEEDFMKLYRRELG